MAYYVAEDELGWGIGGLECCTGMVVVELHDVVALVTTRYAAVGVDALGVFVIEVFQVKAQHPTDGCRPQWRACIDSLQCV